MRGTRFFITTLGALRAAPPSIIRVVYGVAAFFGANYNHAVLMQFFLRYNAVCRIKILRARWIVCLYSVLNVYNLWQAIVFASVADECSTSTLAENPLYAINTPPCNVINMASAICKCEAQIVGVFLFCF